MFFPVKCNVAGHEAEVIMADLSKAYGTEKKHWHVRCNGGGCCFGDYFTRPVDAVFAWNKHHGEKK